MELQLTLDAEVLHRKVVLPIVRQRLVKGSILLVRDVLALTHPERLVLVELLPLVRNLLHFLRLFLLLLLLLLLIDFFYFGLVALFAFLVLLFLLLILRIGDLLLLRLL